MIHQRLLGYLLALTQCLGCGSDNCAHADAMLEHAGACLVNSESEGLDTEQLDQDLMRAELIFLHWTDEPRDSRDYRAAVTDLNMAIRFDDVKNGWAADSEFTCLPLLGDDCGSVETTVTSGMQPEERHQQIIHEWLHVLLYIRYGKDAIEAPKYHQGPWFQPSESQTPWDLALHYYTWYDRLTAPEDCDTAP